MPLPALSPGDAELVRPRGAFDPRRFRILAENASDVVCDVSNRGDIRWVSPSVREVLGWSPEEVVGRNLLEWIVPEDRDDAMERREEVVRDGFSAGHELRLVTSDGEPRWMAVHAKRVLGRAGEAAGAVVSLRDVQAHVIARRAATTVSAGNGILVRAEREDQLLVEMCEMAVDEAGYLFAWYGRPQDDEQESVQPVASSTARRDYLDSISVSWGDNPLGRGPVGNCLRSGEPTTVVDFLREDSCQPWRDAAAACGFRSALSLPVLVDGQLDGAFTVYAAEVNAFDATSAAALRDLAGQLGYGLGRLRDRRRLAVAQEQQRLLSTAIDQAAEAVVVTDTTPEIRYANPAALRVAGYSLKEVLGQNPRMFQSGLHDAPFYEQMWAKLVGGSSWHGVLTNRRKNGEFYEEEATITPVHAANGERIAYVAVKRDLTRERSLEATVSRNQADRDAVATLMRDVRPADTLEETAQSLCRATRRFDDIEGSMVIMVHADGEAVPIAIDGRELPGYAVGRPIEVERLRLLIEMSTAMPWWLDPEDPSGFASIAPSVADVLRAEGYTAAAFVPIKWDGNALGVLALVTRSATARRWMPSRLVTFGEVASFAGMMLGPQAEVHGRRTRLRLEIADVIRRGKFRTVFEPVVHLASGRPVGYEALTRFTDGTPPDQRFAAAESVGMASELEAACARGALAAAADLPHHLWVSLNFSPGAIIDGHAAAVVAGTRRQLVIEITEHNEIENYAAVRRAIASCGDVRVAVDDAGAGFASLRHILELQPDIIKLDLALVRDIDSDPARQALAAGLRHFAALTGTTLIAEGVETEAEAGTIGQLGVELAQGYLYGAPI